jgi:hypothetical protein
MQHRALTLSLSLALALLAGCSINVPHEFDDEATLTSCSVKCPGKGRAHASCNEPRIPACACEPAPTASCVEPRASSR